MLRFGKVMQWIPTNKICKKQPAMINLNLMLQNTDGNEKMLAKTEIPLTEP